MTNTPAVVKPTALTPPQQELLKNLLVELPQDRQLSWLQLGKSKANVKDALDKKVLELQALLLDYEKLDAVKLQTQIDLYNKGLKELPEIRKGFTQYLDKIGGELMGVQKTAEDFDILVKAKQRLLQLKLDEEKKQNESGAKEREQNNFRTHVMNEYIRVKTDYGIALDKRILDEYEKALDEELTEDGLKSRVIILENTLTNMPVPPIVRFSETLPKDYVLQNTAEELQKIGEGVERPNYQSILGSRILDMKDKFNLYFSDKANAEQAINHLKQQQQTNENLAQRQASSEAGINTLTSKVTGSLHFSELKPVQKKRQIKVPEGVDIQWEFKVLTEYAKRFNTCRHRLAKVQSSIKISIGQMVKALQEEVEEISGFEYEEILK